MLKWILLCGIALAADLSAENNVLVFAGSTRTDSTNKKLANEAANIARQLGGKVTLVDLRDYPMPFYDEDLERQAGMPSKAKELRQLMVASQVILIASPNYNGSFSGVLKNALDWASRSETAEPSREAYKGKKFAIMSASSGKSGGIKGLDHLRAVITNIGGSVAAQQVSLPYAHIAFDEDDALTDLKIKSELQQMIEEILL